MRTHQYAHKKRTFQSSCTFVPRPTEVQSSVQPPPIQAKSNEEGLAEHAERLRKFQRLGNSMIQMGPPRLDNNKTSPLQPQPWIQRKLTIGEPGDKYEQEADRVAFQVVQQINAPTSIDKNNLSQSIQREKDLKGVMQSRGFQAAIQRKQAIAGGEATPNLESAINRARGSGQPLDSGLQQSMGQAMGANFSGVRVHTDAQSDQLNQSIQAKAFTTGQDVFFRGGAYQPRSRGGQELIAHELTHVVQQQGSALQRQELQDELQMSGELIVEESTTELSKEQMRKQFFLDLLYKSIREVGREEYEGTNLTVDGCPYIEYWFEKYRSESSSHIERALSKYAGVDHPVESAKELIEKVCVRARKGYKVQVSTGAITQLPSDVPMEVGVGIVPQPENHNESVRGDRINRMVVGQEGFLQDSQRTNDSTTGIIQRGLCCRGSKKEKERKPLLENVQVSDLIDLPETLERGDNFKKDDDWKQIEDLNRGASTVWYRKIKGEHQIVEVDKNLKVIASSYVSLKSGYGREGVIDNFSSAPPFAGLGGIVLERMFQEEENIDSLTVKDPVAGSFHAYKKMGYMDIKYRDEETKEECVQAIKEKVKKAKNIRKSKGLTKEAYDALVKIQKEIKSLEENWITRKLIEPLPGKKRMKNENDNDNF